MKHLVLVLDASDSMDQKDCSQGTTRLMQLKNEVGVILEKVKDETRIHLFRFTHQAVREGGESGKNEAINILENLRTMQGGTDIWNSLDEVAEQLAADGINDAMVLCVTDGEDGSSRVQRSVVEEKFRRLDTVQLQVLILGKKSGSTRAEDKIVRNIDSFGAIHSEMDRLLNERQGLVTQEQLPIHAPVYPLVPCDVNKLQRIQQNLCSIVPFLENLTGLRYYPVPTYVVDRQSIETAIDALPMQQSNELFHDMEQVLRFIRSVCLTFHSGCFRGDFNLTPSGQEPRDNEYADWLSSAAYPEEYRHWLRRYAEWIDQDVLHFMQGASKSGQMIWDNKRKTQCPVRNGFDWFQSIAGSLEHIGLVLEAMKKDTRSAIVLDSEYFEAWSEREPALRALEIWKKYLSLKEGNRLNECVDFNGQWNRESEQIGIAYKLAVKIILSNILLVRSQHSRFCGIIQKIRTQGLYFAPTEQSQRWLHEKLQASGFPKWFQPAGTGYVLLCADECIDTCNAAGVPDLLEGYLRSILTHEHAHAICREGISKDCRFIEWTGEGGQGTAVCETLAEWAELEYARADNEIFEMVSDHAMSGSFPGWPYAGAMLMEKICMKDGVKGYRKIMNLWRLGASEAYQLLVKRK